MYVFSQGGAGGDFDAKNHFWLKSWISAEILEFSWISQNYAKINFARPRPPTLHNPNELLTFLSPGIAKSDFCTQSSTFAKSCTFCENIGNF